MRFQRFAWGVLGATLFVILWGALVRATGSGAGCGRHWPLCNGEILPTAPATATLIELTHRISSGVALLLVVALFWWSRRTFSRGHRARRAAAWSLLFICTEALIGAGLVLLELVGENASLARAAYLAAHLLNTFLLVGSLALTAHWSAPESAARASEVREGRWPLAVGLLLLLVVAMSGAVTALGDTLFPATTLGEGLRADLSPTAHWLIRLRVLHPVLAVLTGVYLWVVALWVPRQRPAAEETLWQRGVMALVVLQLGVGAANLLLLAPVAAQLLHLLVADLLWIAMVVFSASTLDAATVPRALSDPAARQGGLTGSRVPARER